MIHLSMTLSNVNSSLAVRVSLIAMAKVRSTMMTWMVAYVMTPPNKRTQKLFVMLIVSLKL